MPGSIRKIQIRNRIWDLLTHTGVVLFPGAHGRTPLFSGTRKVVHQLRGTDVWERAKRILVLGEPVLQRVRRAVVADGKVLVVPDLSRASNWIIEIDPQRMGLDEALAVATTFDSRETLLPPGVQAQRGTECAPVDLMIIGAVGVDRGGARIGKGAGEADLVYALGRERGFVAATTPVVVLVHQLQILDEAIVQEATDLPVDLIVTPSGTHRVESLRMRPRGLDASMITPERLRNYPGLPMLLEREGLEYDDPERGTA